MPPMRLTAFAVRHTVRKMSAVTYRPKKTWTEEDLQALPEDGYLHEVAHGELIMSPKNNFQYVEICHSPTERRILGVGAALDGEDLLPGFQYPIANLFKGWGR
jgi:hypothetical protein